MPQRVNNSDAVSLDSGFLYSTTISSVFEDLRPLYIYNYCTGVIHYYFWSLGVESVTA